MRPRIPHQPSTKWWILLAALLATAITWLEHRDDLAPRPAPPPVPAGDFVEIEVEGPR